MFKTVEKQRQGSVRAAYEWVNINSGSLVARAYQEGVRLILSVMGVNSTAAKPEVLYVVVKCSPDRNQ